MDAAERTEQGRLQFPFGDPLSSLPETARKILDAATRLLALHGWCEEDRKWLGVT